MNTTATGCASCGSVHHATSAHEGILIRSRAAGHRGWDRRRQNDNAVAYSVAAIAPELLPLWDRVKRTIKGSIDERTEAFLKYAHDHQSDVVAIMIDDADAKLAELLATREANDARTAAYADVVPF